MFKNNALLFFLVLIAMSANAENWRYCSANAPMSAPCKVWINAYLTGKAPETDPQEIPRYVSENTLSLKLNPVNKSELPSFGEASYSAIQPFLKVSTTVLVR